MNKIKTLIGFNIGPIGEIMKHSRKTREIWFGSYMFSMLVKMVYDKMDKEKFQVLKPFSNKDIQKTNTGFFPDRIIASSHETKAELNSLMISIIREVKEDFLEMLNRLIEIEIKEGGELLNSNTRKVLDVYLQMDCVAFDADDINPKDYIKITESYLDALEVSRTYTPGINEPTCERCLSLPGIIETYVWKDEERKKQKMCPFCFMKLSAHKLDKVQNETELSTNKPFPSIMEITADELKEKYEKLFRLLLENDEQDIFTDKSIKTDLKDYHKYIALVTADGDNLGEASKNCNSPQELSECLSQFGKQVYNISKQEFHAEPIYIGGDDLFCMLPMVTKNKTGIVSVFDYIKMLNELYNNLVSEKVTGTTLSIGVVIAYYKFPLNIALEKMYKQLNEKSKSIAGKNALSLLFIQHSGNMSGFTSKLDNPVLAKFNEFFINTVNDGKGFPAVNHKIDKYKNLLLNLRADYQLVNLMEKRFLEGFRSKEQETEFIELMKTALHENATVALITGEDALIAMNNLSDMLHILKFVKGDK